MFYFQEMPLRTVPDGDGDAKDDVGHRAQQRAQPGAVGGVLPGVDQQELPNHISKKAVTSPTLGVLQIREPPCMTVDEDAFVDWFADDLDEGYADDCAWHEDDPGGMDGIDDGFDFGFD